MPYALFLLQNLAYQRDTARAFFSACGSFIIFFAIARSQDLLGSAIALCHMPSHQDTDGNKPEQQDARLCRAIERSLLIFAKLATGKHCQRDERGDKDNGDPSFHVQRRQASENRTEGCAQVCKERQREHSWQSEVT